MNVAYIILGGNIGDVKQTFIKTLNSIELKVGKVTKKSSLYLTKAWGNANQPDFINQAIQVKTLLSVYDLLKTILEIEIEIGRTRTAGEKWMERIIDIDILFYDDAIKSHPDLKIPHPQIQNRKFVLVPMNEIATELVHPLLHKNIQELLNNCEDKLEVIKI